MFKYAATYFGDPDAQYHVGRMYLDGQGVGKNTKQAVRWLFAAANKGQYQAQAVFGALLFKGQSVAHEAARGLMWLILARDAATPEETWITDLYDADSKQATADEVEAASTMASRSRSRFASRPDPFRPQIGRVGTVRPLWALAQAGFKYIALALGCAKLAATEPQKVNSVRCWHYGRTREERRCSLHVKRNVFALPLFFASAPSSFCRSPPCCRQPRSRARLRPLRPFHSRQPRRPSRSGCASSPPKVIPAPCTCCPQLSIPPNGAGSTTPSRPYCTSSRATRSCSRQ